MPDGDSGKRKGRAFVVAAVRRLVSASVSERVLLSLIAVVLSVVVGGVFVFVSGLFASCATPALGPFCYDPFRVYYYMLTGAFGSGFNVALTLRDTSILLLTGLSVVVAFRAGLFNIGTQGQMVLGALATGVVTVQLVPFVPASPVTGALLICVGLFVGTAAGGFYGAIPGVLKVYADANEVITTIMLNIIAAGVAFAFVKVFLAGGGAVQTAPLPEWVRLKPIVVPNGSSFSFVVLVGALLAAVGVYYLLNYSEFGYNVRVSGSQPDAAEFSGVDAKHVVVSTMTLSGALGGLAGAVYVLMSLGYWTSSIPAYGFDGITVSVLATNNPLGAIPAALLFGALRSGSLALDLNTNVPQELAAVLRGILVLLIAMPEFIRIVGMRLDLDAPDEAPSYVGGEEHE